MRNNGHPNCRCVLIYDEPRSRLQKVLLAAGYTVLIGGCVAAVLMWLFA